MVGRGGALAAALLASAMGAACSGGSTSPDASIADRTTAADAVAAADADPMDSEPDATIEPDAAPPDSGEPPDSGVEPWPEVSFDLSIPRPPALLSAIGLVRVRGGVLENHPDALPYQLNTSLFSDYALKSRTIWIPPGTRINYRPREVFDFPVGTIITKTFSFAPDLRVPERDVRPIETRLLVRYPDQWRAFPFVWLPDLSDAEYRPRGGVEPISMIDPFGAPRTANYLIPQRNQCANCHERIDTATGTVAITPIGPKENHLNVDDALGNQLQRWADRGMIAGLPPPSQLPKDFVFASLTSTSAPALLEDATVNAAARDYLDVNCAHCHDRRAVQGVTSQLFLDRESTDELRLGICKEPGSAGTGTGGHRWDIVPGDAEASILLYRINTEVAGEMMPLLGRSLRDDIGVALIRAWIARMPSRNCGQ